MFVYLFFMGFQTLNKFAMPVILLNSFGCLLKQQLFMYIIFHLYISKNWFFSCGWLIICPSALFLTTLLSTMNNFYILELIKVKMTRKCVLILLRIGWNLSKSLTNSICVRTENDCSQCWIVLSRDNNWFDLIFWNNYSFFHVYFIDVFYLWQAYL